MSVMASKKAKKKIKLRLYTVHYAGRISRLCPASLARDMARGSANASRIGELQRRDAAG